MSLSLASAASGYRSWPSAILGMAISILAIQVYCRSMIADEPLFQVKLEKPGDSAVFLEESRRTVLLINTETGIGRITLSSPGRWPRDITLRLKSVRGPKFDVLEGFEMTTSRLQIRASSRDSAKVPFFLADETGKFSRDDLNPSGWLNVVFKPADNHLDILFPSHLWRDEKEVRIQWIDRYR